MKKLVLYIALPLIGIVLSSATLEKPAVKYHSFKNSDRYAVFKANPEEEKPVGFAQTMSSQIGKVLIMKGVVQEVYKNNKNEVIIYLKDRKIPVTIHCTLSGSEYQIKYPLRLGENISIKGKFTKITDEMYLANCRIMKREPK